MMIRVNARKCDGHALCAAMADDVYAVDEDTGYNTMGEFEIPETLAASARRGAAACPEQAIAVLDGTEL